MMRNSSKLFAIIAISCLGIFAYSNTFHCSFHLDDRSSIAFNLAIRNIHDLQQIWNFWPSRFITYFSIALNYHFNGLDVGGYHLFNLLVHLGAAVLVWWLTRLTLATPVMKQEKIAKHADVISLLAGLIFVAHPIQTEAVTYIVQRASSMATLFYLASLCFYIKARLPIMDSRFRGNDKSNNVIPAKAGIQLGGAYYICSLITAVLAMFCKEMAITLPLMILLYECCFFKAKGSLKWKYLVPFWLTLLIIPLAVKFTGSTRLQIFREGPGISPVDYLLTQFRVMLTYIRLAFFPLNQNIDYDYPVFKSIFDMPVLVSFLFLSAILIFAKNLFSKYRMISFCILWFFLTLLPESSFLPIKDVIFEHRLYLPLVGYSILLASCGYYLLGKNSIKMMVMVLSLIVACYSVLTYQRNKIWNNEFTLWNDTIDKSPHKARAYDFRGTSWANQGKYAQAISDYSKAIILDPQNAEAYNNRGNSYKLQGKIVDAMSDFNRAIELRPNYAAAYYNRGLIYDEQDKIAQALSDYTKAIEIDPHYAPAYENRGIIYADQGKYSLSISDLNKAVEIDPDNAAASKNRAVVYKLLMLKSKK